MPVYNIPNQAPDTTLMQVAQMMESIKRRRIEQGQMQLQTLMELGGKQDTGTLENISKKLGMDPNLLKGQLTQVSGDPSTGNITGYFPSRSEREIAAKTKDIKATAGAKREVAAIEGETAATIRGASRPVLRGELQDAADIELAKKTKEIDLETDALRKRSNEITIPENKAIYENQIAGQKEVATYKLANDMALERFKKGLSDRPTPLEKAQIELYEAHAKYFNEANGTKLELAELTRSVKGANTEFANKMKIFQDWEKVNKQLLFDLDKGGVLTPKEYVPGSQEERALLESANAAGVRLKKVPIPHAWSSDGVSYIASGPDISPDLLKTLSEAPANTQSLGVQISVDELRKLPRNADGTVTYNGQQYNVGK